MRLCNVQSREIVADLVIGKRPRVIADKAHRWFVIAGLTRNPVHADNWIPGQARDDSQTARDDNPKARDDNQPDWGDNQALSRATPCTRRCGSFDAKHQRSQPRASGAKASPGARPSPASNTRRLAVTSESS